MQAFKTVMFGAAVAAMALSTGSTVRAQGQDIVDTAVAAGQFKTLAAALTAAGLVPTLKGAGPFTVFAPTDEAFARLPAGTVQDLLKPENKERLAALLKYHVVPGRVFSDAAAKGATVGTLQGQSVTTRSKDGKVYVNDAAVIQAEIWASSRTTRRRTTRPTTRPTTR